MGGIGVLLPLLEQVSEAEQVFNGGQEISDLLGPELTSPRGPAAMLLPLNKSVGEFMFSSGILRKSPSKNGNRGISFTFWGLSVFLLLVPLLSCNSIMNTKNGFQYLELE